MGIAHRVTCLTCFLVFWAIVPEKGYHIITCPKCGQRFAIDNGKGNDHAS